MIPQIIHSCELQLITPCFCAGADQETPELRAASFRGELRWWFRCLGGSREQEQAVFGGVHRECIASAIALLVVNVKPSPPDYRWEFERPNIKVANSAYITYFLSANEKNAGDKKVVRADAYLPPKKKFTLELRQLREISPENRELLSLAWHCLCNLGAIGARKTRALGAYAPVKTNEQKVPELLNHSRVKKYFDFRLLDKKEYGDFGNGAVTTQLLSVCAQKLKEYRKSLAIHPTLGKGQTAKQGVHYGTSALGNAIGERQSSALRFRPVLIDNKLYLCILKAPDFTLGERARQHNIPNL